MLTTTYKKRILDLLLSSTLLIILLPIFFLSYPPLLIIIGSPIIFKQKRAGKDKKEFTIYKLRTMKTKQQLQQSKNNKQKTPTTLTNHELQELNIAPLPMFKIKNDPRFHSLGKLLSHFGIDELPQLINILKGEMSLIGPRPLPINESRQLDSSWNFRYKVLPGIISTWAISPKRYNSLTIWKKLEKETVENINNYSIKQNIFLITKAVHLILIKPITTKITKKNTKYS